MNPGFRAYQTFRNFHLLPVLAIGEYGGGWTLKFGWGCWGVEVWF